LLKAASDEERAWFGEEERRRLKETKVVFTKREKMQKNVFIEQPILEA